MSVESRVRAALRSLDAGFVSLNYYGPWKVKLVYSIGDEYFEATSEVDNASAVCGQSHVDNLHEVQLRSMVTAEVHARE